MIQTSGEIHSGYFGHPGRQRSGVFCPGILCTSSYHGHITLSCMLTCTMYSKHILTSKYCLVIRKLANTHFLGDFTGEGTLRYKGCDSTKNGGQSLEQCPWLIVISPCLGEGERCFVLWWNLKWLAVCLVWAEMLNCKLLSPQAAGIKHLYFTWCDGNHLMASHSRTLASARCFKEI